MLIMFGERAQAERPSAIFNPTTGSLATRCILIWTNKMAKITGPHFFKKYRNYLQILGTTVAQWLRRCAINRKVASSIPDDIIGIFL